MGAGVTVGVGSHGVRDGTGVSGRGDTYAVGVSCVGSADVVGMDWDVTRPQAAASAANPIPDTAFRSDSTNKPGF